MPGTGSQVWRGHEPRRWTAILAALVLGGAIFLEFVNLRVQCPGRLLTWGLCNSCGEMTQNRIEYRSRQGPTGRMRYYCPACVEDAPRSRWEFEMANRGSEDWSLAIRFGIQAVVLFMLGVSIVAFRFADPRQVSVAREIGDLLPGPIHVTVTAATAPGAWLPLFAAGGAWILMAAITFRHGGPTPTPPRSPGSPPDPHSKGPVHEPFRTGWAHRMPEVAACVTVAFMVVAGGLGVSRSRLEGARRERNARETALKDKVRALHQGEEGRGAKEKALERSVLASRDKEKALKESQRSPRTARALALVSASKDAQSGDNQRALLLAREAVGLEDRTETVSRLHEALDDPQETAFLRGHEGAVTSASFSPDGTRVLTWSKDRTARLWDVTGKEVAVLRGHAGEVCSAEFSPDGTRVLTGSQDRTARLWDLTGKEIAVLRGHAGEVYSAAFSPDGTGVLTWSQDRTARLWDLAGKETAVLRGHEGGVFYAAFSRDGKRVLTGSWGCTACLWDLTGREELVLRGHEDVVLSAMLSPDGTRILTWSHDETVRLWDLTGKQVAVLRADEDGFESAVFSPDGTRVLTGSDDQTARLWDLKGKEVAVLRGHEDGVFTAVFSPDVTRVLTGSDDQTARLWDLTGKEIAVLRGHEDGVFTAVFSPDGKRVLTGSWDHTARLWDLTGKEIAVLRGHKDGVNSAAFSPDGTRVLTAGDNTARLWLVHTKDLLALANSRITRDFTPEEREKYKDLLPEQPESGSTLPAGAGK